MYTLANWKRPRRGSKLWLWYNSPGIQIGEGTVFGLVVTVEVQRFLIKGILDDILLQFVKGIETLEVYEGLAASFEMVIDLEMAAKGWELVQVLDEGQILARIPL
ncbi:hypothetical protein HYQ46_007694 [Verticillium longisporum]|nr:hypothetical protein HYQ46_007694 [Verticillium longisporum]